MATTTETKETSTTSTGEKNTSSSGDEKSAVKPVSKEAVEKIAKDPRFSLGPPPIQTAEDAYYAFLREEISEDELRAVVSKFGGAPFSTTKILQERPDNAYVRTVPEDLVEDPTTAISSVEERIKVAKDNQEAAHKATEEDEKKQEKVQPVKVVN